MVAAANKVAVVVEKRIIGTMRADNGEEEAVGWNDLQEVKRVVYREAGKSIFSTRLAPTCTPANANTEL